MAQVTRLDLLLKEIEDPYVQENFLKLRRYLNCLDSGQTGPRGSQGPSGAPGQDGVSDQEYTFNTDIATNTGDAVFQDYTQVAFVNKFASNDSPDPFIGVIVSKPTGTTATVKTIGLIDTVLGEGPVFMSATGTLQLGVPGSGPWQRMGYSFGDGKMWLAPERTRIRGC